MEGQLADLRNDLAQLQDDLETKASSKDVDELSLTVDKLPTMETLNKLHTRLTLYVPLSDFTPWQDQTTASLASLTSHSSGTVTQAHLTTCLNELKYQIKANASLASKREECQVEHSDLRFLLRKVQKELES